MEGHKSVYFIRLDLSHSRNNSCVFSITIFLMNNLPLWSCCRTGPVYPEGKETAYNKPRLHLIKVKNPASLNSL